MTVRSGWLLTSGQTREDTRLVPVGTMVPEDPMRTRAGVIAGGDSLAATSAGPMQVQIGTGRAVVQGTDAQGAYPVAVTAPEVLTVTDGDALHPRIDIVALRVRDGLYDPDSAGQTLATIEIIQGQPTTPPQPPALPPATLPLWHVAVPAGTSAGTGGVPWSSALADRRRYTAAYGGIIPRGTAADAGPYDGAYADHGGTLMRWSASAGAWQVYRHPPAPPVTATGSAVAVAAPGWTLHNAQGVRTAGMITVRVQVERTGPDYGPAASDGNLVDLLMFTVRPEWRPHAIYGVERMPTIVTDSYGDGAGYLTPNSGAFELVSWGPGAKVVKERWHRVLMTYPAP
ncbi:hypothetical protein [Streptomyces buecherae]|uniref:Uncharacterized protein n=1 Tax=Streptomyces buecherae TaxID=2763006 RepID=A0A7H8NB59_9ACTN|nr:hypothetical protein [Streptomyces buecherae]QKW51683.1 hypothetical protein HUT08_21570 [Streptomyces buecherae]